MKVNATKLSDISEKPAYFLLKGILSLIFILHGVARIYYWSIQDFGSFLNSKGFVVGVFIAWIITLGEIIGGVFLLLGYKVKYVVAFNFLVIASGIFLVHLKNGWFVVGHGENGVEFSLLILTVLIFIYNQESQKYKLQID